MLALLDMVLPAGLQKYTSLIKYGIITIGILAIAGTCWYFIDEYNDRARIIEAQKEKILEREAIIESQNNLIENLKNQQKLSEDLAEIKITELSNTLKKISDNLSTQSMVIANIRGRVNGKACPTIDDNKYVIDELRKLDGFKSN